MADQQQSAPIRVSIAIRAWNEEAILGRTLGSLFEQTFFEELERRGERCEVVCLPNGCTDRTADIARDVFAGQQQSHPARQAFVCRVEEMSRAGRNHTWNALVHDLTAREAEFLIIMDSDILFDRRDTLFNMYLALLNSKEACVASDRAIKDLALKPRKSWRDRISLASSNMTGTIQGQITGQLYCIRSEVARRLYLPLDLGIDDGFMKAVVCTDFFRRELNPSRIIVAPNASHVYEAYSSIPELLNNQKRQMIGQATVHVLIEYLKRLPLSQRVDLSVTLRRLDETDPTWLKRLLDEHLRRTRFFWRLFPDALTFRFQRWWKMAGLRRLTYLPATLAGFAVTLIACARAHRHLRDGDTQYWPKASRTNLQRLTVGPSHAACTPSPAGKG